MALEIDHIAVTCARLETGVQAVEKALGVTLMAGGKHARFGTHNAVLGLADGLYLEVVAPDPMASAPDVPRWFGLDAAPDLPIVGSWICRSDHLEADMAKVYGPSSQPLDLKRGALEWRMGLGPMSETPWDNMFPAMIDWLGQEPVGHRLPTSQCKLETLEISHPNSTGLAERLRALGLDDHRLQFKDANKPGLRARLTTANGEIWL